MCSELTVKTPERHFTHFSSVSIVGFEQVNVSWVSCRPLICSFTKN